MANRSRGRPRGYAEFDELVAGLPTKMAKRRKYLEGIRYCLRRLGPGMKKSIIHIQTIPTHLPQDHIS